jgi:hypothetical protein
MGCAPLCKCVAPDTPIATAWGEAPIASLRVGDLVYSVDRGSVRLVPILRTRQVPAKNHRVVRLTLATGSVLEISALHPTADGRSIGQLRQGDLLDGVAIRGAETIPYEHAATYDILPDSDSGTYFAAGVLLASTLAEVHCAGGGQPAWSCVTTGCVQTGGRQLCASGTYGPPQCEQHSRP